MQPRGYHGVIYPVCAQKLGNMISTFEEFGVSISYQRRRQFSGPLSKERILFQPISEKVYLQILIWIIEIQPIKGGVQWVPY